jgi:hypothetical protein
MRIFLLLFIAITITSACTSPTSTNDKPSNETASIPVEKADSTPNKAPTIGSIDNYEKSSIDADNIHQGKAPAQWMIVPGTRAGNIRQNSTLGSIESAYGKNNITNEGIIIGGQAKDGSILKFYKTTVFKGQPNEAIILWADTVLIKNPVQVIINGKDSDWVTTRNIKVGTTLQYLLDLNGKDFYFLGFDDEQYNGQFSGMVTWNKGNMNNSLGVVLAPSLISKTMDIFPKFQTLQKYPTNHPDVPALGLRVKEIRVTFD